MQKALPEMIHFQMGSGLPEGFVPKRIFFSGRIIISWECSESGIFSTIFSEGASHIGYGIKKEYRGKGYASRGLDTGIGRSAQTGKRG